MQPYAIILACPMAVLIQHLYSETRISFNKYIRIMVIHFFINIIFLFVLNFFVNISNTAIIEYIASYIGGLLVGVIIGNFEPKKSLDEYETYEGIVISAQAIMGIIICFLVISKWFENKFYVQIIDGDILLSKIVLVRLGLSFVFYNRYCFTRIRKVKRDNF